MGTVAAVLRMIGDAIEIIGSDVEYATTSFGVTS